MIKAEEVRRRQNAIRSELLLRRLRKYHGRVINLPAVIIPNPLLEIGKASFAKTVAVKASKLEASMIISAVSAYFDVPVKQIVGPRRTKDLILPRQVAVYLAVELTALSLPTLGRVFLRDHTTLLHGKNRIAERIKTDAKLAAQVNVIRSHILSVVGEAAKPKRYRRDYETHWTAERIKQLVQYRKQNKSYLWIAEQLGNVTAAACCNRYARAVNAAVFA